MVETIRYCPDCSRERLFEQPHALAGTCPDTADGSCAEWFCAGCGAALLIGFMSAAAQPTFTQQPGSRVA